MTDEGSRSKLVEWLKSNDFFAVHHFGHFANYFHVMSWNATPIGGSPLDKGEIYAAMYEEFDDKFEMRFHEVKRLVLKEGESWSSILMRLVVEG